MAFNSSSVKFLYICQGIGGRRFLEPGRPLYFPSFMASINCASVQLPLPVASEVRLAVYEVPHGPTQVVDRWLPPALFAAFPFCSHWVQETLLYVLIACASYQ